MDKFVQEIQFLFNESNLTKSLFRYYSNFIALNDGFNVKILDIINNEILNKITSCHYIRFCVRINYKLLIWTSNMIQIHNLLYLDDVVSVIYDSVVRFCPNVYNDIILMYCNGAIKFYDIRLNLIKIMKLKYVPKSFSVIDNRLIYLDDHFNIHSINIDNYTDIISKCVVGVTELMYFENNFIGVSQNSVYLFDSFIDKIILPVYAHDIKIMGIYKNKLIYSIKSGLNLILLDDMYDKYSNSLTLNFKTSVDICINNEILISMMKHSNINYLKIYDIDTMRLIRTIKLNADIECY